MTASKLIRPHIDYKDSYIEAVREYHSVGRYKHFDIDKLERDFEAFVKRLQLDKSMEHRPFQEWVEPVPETIAWLVKDEAYLGSVAIRHRLNWHLEKWGGHLHFIIRPTMRGKGFGKTILRKAIPLVNHLGIERALITVAPDNTKAIRCIEACGGEFEDETSATDKFPARKRYWINCN